MANVYFLEETAHRYFIEETDSMELFTRQEVFDIIEKAGCCIVDGEAEAFEIHIQKPCGNDSTYFRAFRFYLDHPNETEYFDAEKITERIIWAFIEDFHSSNALKAAIEFDYSICKADDFNADFAAYFKSLYDDKECFSDDFRIFVLNFKPVGY